MSELADVKRKVAEFEAKGDVKKAILELEKAVDEFQKEGSLFNKLGDLYIKVNRKEDALQIYERGARVFKDETYFPNAIALCKKILRLDKDCAGVYHLLGELHKELDQRGEAANYFLEYAERKMKENDMDAALDTYNIIKELVPNNPKILETISAIYEKAGKGKEGEELRKEAHKLETKQEQLRESIIAQEKTKQEEATRERVEEEPVVEEPVVEEEIIKEPVVEEESPAEEEVREEPAVEKEEEEAETLLDESASLEDFVSPEVAELLRDDREPSVKEGLDEAPSAALSDIDKTVELGELYLNLGSEDEAVDCFRNAADEACEGKEYNKALELNKRIAGLRPFDLRSRQQMVEIAQIKKDRNLQVSSMLDLAESLSRRDAKSEARSLYKKILKIDPDNPTAKEMYAAFEQPKDFIDLGEVLRSEMQEEQVQQGIQSIEGLVSQFRKEVFQSIGEGDFRSRYDLGVAYKGMGLFQEAIEEFEMAAKDRELKLKALEMIGSCFLERNKVDDAIAVLNEALKVTGHPPKEYFGIYFLLGSCYEQQKKIKEALTIYMQAYKIDKSVPELARKINELKNKYAPGAAKAVPKKAAAEVKKSPGKPKPKEKVKAKKSKITYL